MEGWGIQSHQLSLQPRELIQKPKVNFFHHTSLKIRSVYWKELSGVNHEIIKHALVTCHKYAMHAFNIFLAYE